MEEETKTLLDVEVTFDNYQEMLRFLLHPAARNQHLGHLPKFDMKVKEAMQMQLIVQRQLHEQLEIHRTLQLRIEEQAKKLKMMFDQHKQQKANKSQSSEIISSHDYRYSTNLDDDEILDLEDNAENSQPR